MTYCHRGMLLSNTTILFSIMTGGIKNPPVVFFNKILVFFNKILVFSNKILVFSNKILVFSNKILVFSIYSMKHLQDTWKIVTFAY